MKKTVALYKGGQMIIEEVFLADTFFNRLCGLIPSKDLEENKGIILIPCRQIHTFFMKISIDAVFLSKENIVIHIEHCMRPNKTTRYIKSAECVLELSCGAVEKLNINNGDVLRLL